MKRLLTLLAMALMTTMLLGQDITLPSPKKNVRMSLFKALDQRESERNFSKKKIKDEKLSQLLWASAGINRPNGRRTFPSALNTQEVMVFVCREDGAYLFNPQKNVLKKVSGKDLRKDIADNQKEVAKAPVFIVLAADLNKFKGRNDKVEIYGALDVGYVSQNVCLACEALGLATVPRASMDKRKLEKALDLKKGQELFINHPVGYKK